MQNPYYIIDDSNCSIFPAHGELIADSLDTLIQRNDTNYNTLSLSLSLSLLFHDSFIDVSRNLYENKQPMPFCQENSTTTAANAAWQPENCHGFCRALCLKGEVYTPSFSVLFKLFFSNSAKRTGRKPKETCCFCSVLNFRSITNFYG